MWEKSLDRVDHMLWDRTSASTVQHRSIARRRRRRAAPECKAQNSPEDQNRQYGSQTVVHAVVVADKAEDKGLHAIVNAQVELLQPFISQVTGYRCTGYSLQVNRYTGL